MIVGVPKEIKDNEFRVAMVPSGVRALKDSGHRALIETNAGLGAGISDDEYQAAGAEILKSPKEVFSGADIIVKVKEPLPPEYGYLREGLIVFTFFHLATKKELAEALVKNKVIAIAYETVEEKNGNLPLLKPMSEVAGKLSVQVGAQFLMKQYGGRGVLLGGVPGVERGSVVILGAGTVGINAAKVAVGLGAEVTVIDVNTERFRHLDDIFGSRVKTLMSNAYNIERAVVGADLLIGATHIPGAKTPRLVSKALVSRMKKGSVIVDVAVDQGGCVETIRPTTHSEPTYEEDGVIHYGVANMPGAVPRTSTFALTNATLPYVLKLANLGFKKAVEGDSALFNGVNAHKGVLCNKNVSEALGMEYKGLEF
ncbi:MAG: alanine dehydrogenase [Thermodesulfobacteriota bacterium]